MGDRKKGLSRRQAILLAGAAGAGLASCRTTSPDAAVPIERDPRDVDPPAKAQVWRSRKPVVNGQTLTGHEADETSRRTLLLGPEDSVDPAAHSRVENLFWIDRLREHAQFFALLMPGDELEEPRDEAERFLTAWQTRYEEAKVASFDPDTYALFNRGSLDLARRMSAWKRKMADAQAAGRLRSLVWPSFFEGAAREADWFVQRLELYNARKVALDRNEVIDFWAHDTAGHLAMIAHLLDPEEADRVRRALEMSQRWREIRASKPARRADDPVFAAEREVIDFKTALARGLETGQVRSILRPLMLEHMRREAMRFADELKRSRS